jgi:hypothetical protein
LAGNSLILRKASYQNAIISWTYRQIVQLWFLLAILFFSVLSNAVSFLAFMIIYSSSFIYMSKNPLQVPKFRI